MDPEARASDRDRETTVVRLQKAYVDGRLTSEEMESRVERALTAVSHGDLAMLTADLPERPGEVVTLTSKAGKIVRTGQWRVPRVLRLESEFADPRLDLTEAEIDYPEIILDLHLSFGSARITLPQGASADTDEVTCEWSSVSSEAPGAARPGLLHVRVTGELSFSKVRISYRGTTKRRWFTR